MLFWLGKTRIDREEIPAEKKVMQFKVQSARSFPWVARSGQLKAVFCFCFFFHEDRSRIGQPFVFVLGFYVSLGSQPTCLCPVWNICQWNAPTHQWVTIGWVRWFVPFPENQARKARKEGGRQGMLLRILHVASHSFAGWPVCWCVILFLPGFL